MTKFLALNVRIPKNKNWRLFGLYVFHLVYLLIGASIFSIIEYPNEWKEIEKMMNARKTFLMKFPEVPESELDRFVELVAKLNSRGIPIFRNKNEKTDDILSSSWSFGQSFFFVTTVVTTIGYGHNTPLTSSGKLFCIIYASIGVPLTMILMSVLVDRLLSQSDNLLLTLIKFFGISGNTDMNSGDDDTDKLVAGSADNNIDNLPHVVKNCHDDVSNSPPEEISAAAEYKYGMWKRMIALESKYTNIRYLHFSLLGSAVIVCFIFIPAVVFCQLENEWNYLDSVYYCFISLTTIGLGDFIPGDDNPNSMWKPIYKACTSVYLLIGVTLLMLMLTIFHQIPSFNYHPFFCDEVIAAADSSCTMTSFYQHQIQNDLTSPDLENNETYIENYDDVTKMDKDVTIARTLKNDEENLLLNTKSLAMTKKYSSFKDNITCD